MDYEKVHSGSKEVYSTSLDLTSMPVTNMGVLSSDYLQVHASPGYTDNDSSLITFNIPATAGIYTQLNSSFLYLQVRIVSTVPNTQGSVNLADNLSLAPNECFFPSLIQNCQILLNDTPISRNQSGLYGYKHVLDNTLECSESLKNTILSEELWYEDNSSSFDTTNTNYGIRSKFAEKSNIIELIGKLHDGIMTSQKVLPDHVNIQIHIRRSHPLFCLVGKGITVSNPFQYRVKFESAIFFAKRLLINPKVLAKHHAYLNSGKRFSYGLKNRELKSFQIASSTLVYNSDILWNGDLPSYLIICFVAAKAFSGELTSSPFAFEQHNVQQITVYVEGSNTNMYRQLSFAENMELLAYHSLSSILPAAEFVSHGLDRRDYKKKNKFISVVELLPMHRTERFNLQGSHQLKMEIRFSKALTESIMCICSANFDSLLTIDKAGNIYTDALAI